jgi:hypothetical protein
VLGKQGKRHERIAKNGLGVRNPDPGKTEFVRPGDPTDKVRNGTIGQDTDMKRNGHGAFRLNNV